MILSRVIVLAVLSSASAMLGRFFTVGREDHGAPADDDSHAYVQLADADLNAPLNGGQRRPNTFLSARRALSCLAAAGGLAAAGVYTVSSRGPAVSAVALSASGDSPSPLLTSAVVPGTYESFYSGLKEDLAAGSIIDASALATTFLDAHEWALDQRRNGEAFEIIRRVKAGVIAPAKAQVAGWRCNPDSCEAEQTNNSWLIRDSARWGRLNQEMRVVVENQLAELEAIFVRTKADLNQTIRASEGAADEARRGGGAPARTATASRYVFLKRFILHASRMLGVGLDSQSQEFYLHSGGAALCTSNVLPLTAKQYEQETIFAYWRHMYGGGNKNKSAEELKVQKMWEDAMKAIMTNNESGLTPMVAKFYFRSYG